MADIFNDYDADGWRINAANCRTSRTQDNAIVYNLRFTYKDGLKDISDQQILNSYDLFAVSEDFGDDDIWFKHWLEVQATMADVRLCMHAKPAETCTDPRCIANLLMSNVKVTKPERDYKLEDLGMRAHSSLQAVQVKLMQAMIHGYMSSETKNVCCAQLKDAIASIDKLPKPGDRCQVVDAI